MQQNNINTYTIILANFQNFGGVEHVVHSFMRDINKYSNKNFSLCLASDKKNKLNYNWLKDISFHRLNVNNSKIVRCFNRFIIYKYLFKNRKNTFIIIHVNKVLKYAISLKKILNFFGMKFTIVYWDHGIITNPDFIPMQKRKKALLLSCDKIMVLTKTARDLALSYGIKKEDVIVTYNAIYPQVKTISYNKHKNLFVLASRIELKQSKNIELLVNAVKLLPNLEFIVNIYGDGPDYQNLQKLIIEQELSNKIILKGYHENCWQDITECTALISTSKSEGFSLSIHEAFSYGIPVISSNFLGSSEIINQSNGILFDVNYTKQLALAMETMIEKRHLYSAQTIKDSIQHTYIDRYYANLVNQLFK